MGQQQNTSALPVVRIQQVLTLGRMPKFPDLEQVPTPSAHGLGLAALVRVGSPRMRAPRSAVVFPLAQAAPARGAHRQQVAAWAVRRMALRQVRQE